MCQTELDPDQARQSVGSNLGQVIISCMRGSRKFFQRGPTLTMCFFS